MSVCDKDCLHCKYPDCINDTMDHQDYIEAARRDKALFATPQSKKVAAQQKAYYEANREKHCGAVQRCYENNRRKLERVQRVITIARELRGMKQVELARRIFVAQPVLSNYEAGKLPAPWDALDQVMPELKEMREKGCEAYCDSAELCKTGLCKYRMRSRPKKGG